MHQKKYARASGNNFKAAIASAVLAMTGATSSGCASTPDMPTRSSDGFTHSNSGETETNFNVLAKPATQIAVNIPGPTDEDEETISLVKEMRDNLHDHQKISEILTEMAGMPIILVTPELLKVQDAAFAISEENSDDTAGSIPWKKYPKKFQLKAKDVVRKFVEGIDSDYTNNNRRFLTERITITLFENGFVHRADQINPPEQKGAACIIYTNRTLDKKGIREQLAFFSGLEEEKIEHVYGDVNGWFFFTLLHEYAHCTSNNLHEEETGIHRFREELKADYEALKYYVWASGNDENVPMIVYARAISMVERGFISSGAGGFGEDQTFTHAIGLALQKRLRGDELSDAELSRIYGAATYIADILENSGSGSDLKSHVKTVKGIIKDRPNNYYIKDLLNLYLEGLRLLAPDASGLEPLQLETSLLTPQSRTYATASTPSKNQCVSQRFPYHYGL